MLTHHYREALARAIAIELRGRHQRPSAACSGAGLYRPSTAVDPRALWTDRDCRP
jgi:hypothetical protein